MQTYVLSKKMKGQTDRNNKQTYKHMDEWTNNQTKTNRIKDGSIDLQKNDQTDRMKHKMTNGQIDR
jgi:hypothetical protein